MKAGRGGVPGGLRLEVERSVDTSMGRVPH